MARLYNVVNNGSMYTGFSMITSLAVSTSAVSKSWNKDSASWIMKAHIWFNAETSQGLSFYRATGELHQG